MLPYATEELNDFDDDDDNDENVDSSPVRKNSTEEASPLNQSGFLNSFNNCNTHASKYRKNQYESNQKMPLSLRRNSLMRKYHTFYACDSTASLNILKILIESKIKFPTHANSVTSLTDKLRMKREKKNESEFLLELVKDISNELNLKSLSSKIINNLKVLVNAEKASLFFVCHSRKCLASFKFDPHAGVWDPTKFTSSTALSYDTLSNDFDMEIPFGNTLLGIVAESGNIINIPNASKVSVAFFIIY